MNATAPLVCIVEDDDAVRSSLMALLDTKGYVTRQYTCAEEFLQAPDWRAAGCVIVDLRLPGINGVELLERLAADGSRCGAVLISGHGDGATISRPAGLQSLSVLSKPCDPTQLLDLVSAALDRAAD